MPSLAYCLKLYSDISTPEEMKALRAESRALALKKKVPIKQATAEVVKGYRDEAQREYNKIEKVIKKHYGVTEKPVTVKEPKAVTKKEEPKFSVAAPMYSALTRAAEAPKFPANIPAKSVINQLKKASGVKQVEIEVSGLPEWLEGKDKVSKTELVDFLKMNEVQIEEVEKGETLTHERLSWMKRGNIYKPSSEFEVGIVEHLPSSGEYVYEDLEGVRDAHNTLDEAKDAVLEAAKDIGIRDTKFAEHVLPGGEPGSYRELVLRAPGEKRKIPPKVLLTETKRMAELAGENWETLGPNGRQGYENQARIDLEKSVEYGYRSAHWDEPNVIAHIRGDTRIGSDGKRRFHVAEFQSDIYSRIVELEQEKKSYTEIIGRKKPEEIDADVFSKTQRGLQLRYEGINEELSNLKKLFPWGENWHELVAKKALEYVVKNVNNFLV